MKMLFTGFDSAWGGRAAGAFCDLEWDDQRASLTLAQPLEATTWDQAVQRIESYSSHDNHVIAIDQGLIVPNETGMRVVEWTIQKAFMKPYGCGAHSSNRSNKQCYGKEAGIWRFLRALDKKGYQHRPNLLPRAAGGRFYFECYPHPALLGLFSLPKLLPYKVRHRNPEAWARLLSLLGSLERPEIGPRVEGATRIAAPALPQNKDNEDKLDAFIAAYVASFYWFHKDRCAMIGDMEGGYVITPVTDAMRAHLKSAGKPRLDLPGRTPRIAAKRNSSDDGELYRLCQRHARTQPGGEATLKVNCSNILDELNPWIEKGRGMLLIRIHVEAEPLALFFRSNGPTTYGFVPGENIREEGSAWSWGDFSSGASNAELIELPITYWYL